jgi:uncharacterized sulfatase
LIVLKRLMKILKNNSLMFARFGCLLLALLMIGFHASGLAAGAKPNFLIIIGDDVGYDAFGCTGSGFAHTPNIDKLAGEGLVFDRFYGTVSQCGPIRTELYTGLFPVNNGKLANARSIVKEGVKSVVDHLKPLGYDVGLTGKSHFSKGGKFKRFNGFPTGANSSVAEYDVDGLRGFIKEAQASDRSFCAVIGSIHAHHPWDLGDVNHFEPSSMTLPSHWVDSPGAREALARHAAEVEELDGQVGTTLELLEEMALSDDTVVIFLSEQGIAMPRAKWSIYDHGNRSLCIMRWPGIVKPRRTAALGQYCDIVPTLVDLAGGKDPGLDGFSLQPLFDGGSDAHRDFVYLYNVHPTWQRAIIHDGWKLVWSPEVEKEHIWNNFTSKSKFFAVPWAEWLALAKTDPDVAARVEHVIHPKEYELYRIDEDFYETNNLAASPGHQERIETMAGDLKAFMKKLGDPLYDPASADKPKSKKRKNRKAKQ